MIELMKNQVIELDITALSSEGLGIGRSDGAVVFVNGAVPGDRVEAKIVKVLKNHSFGIVEKLISASENRVENHCPAFPQCGGCKLRQLSYTRELEAKNGFVQQNLQRIGGVCIELDPIIPSPEQERYRNKAQYPVALIEGKARVGFYASRSHRTIPIEDCLLQPNEFSEISKIVCEFIDENRISVYDESLHKGLIRHLCLRKADSGIMVTLIINGKNLPSADKLVEKLKAEAPKFQTLTLSHNTQKTNVVMGAKETVIHGEGIIRDELCGVKLELSANSFYQVNKEATKLLYDKVKEFADPQKNEILLDLYCGIGAIGLSMAGLVKKMVGVEIVSKAIEDAKNNGLKNGIKNADFICADAGKAAHALAQEGVCPDTIIIDPPRKGIDGLTINSICLMEPRKLVYVSCNSATLARDLKLLEAEGYKTVRGVAVDMFPRTMHVESVVLLVRGNTP